MRASPASMHACMQAYITSKHIPLRGYVGSHFCVMGLSSVAPRLVPFMVPVRQAGYSQAGSSGSSGSRRRVPLRAYGSAVVDVAAQGTSHMWLECLCMRQHAPYMLCCVCMRAMGRDWGTWQRTPQRTGSSTSSTPMSDAICPTTQHIDRCMNRNMDVGMQCGCALHSRANMV